MTMSVAPSQTGSDGSLDVSNWIEPQTSAGSVTITAAAHDLIAHRDALQEVCERENATANVRRLAEVFDIATDALKDLDQDTIDLALEPGEALVLAGAHYGTAQHQFLDHHYESAFKSRKRGTDLLVMLFRHLPSAAREITTITETSYE